MDIETKLLPCPMCGGTKGYQLSEGSTYRWWNMNCKDCGRIVDECSSDRRMTINEPLPERCPDADENWNNAAEYAEALRAQVASLQELLARKDEALQCVHDQLIEGKVFTQQVHPSPYWRYEVGNALALKASDVKASATISKMETVDYVLVPREPTETMLSVGGALLAEGSQDRPELSWADEAILTYKAMIAAYEQVKV